MKGDSKLSVRKESDARLSSNGFRNEQNSLKVRVRKILSGYTSRYGSTYGQVLCNVQNVSETRYCNVNCSSTNTARCATRIHRVLIVIGLIDS